MTERSHRGSPLQRLLIWLLAILLPVALFIILRSTPAGITVLPVPYEISKPKPAWFQRVSGPLRPWWWRFKSWVLGPPRGVTLDAVMIDCTESAASSLAKSVAGNAEFADTNGLQVWRLGTNEMKVLRQQLEQNPGNVQLSRPRVTTASGVQAQMFTGNILGGSSVGLVADFLPRVRRDGTDLTTVITLTSIWTNQPITTSTAQPNALFVRTNFAVAARIQIPNGQGTLLLKSASQGPKDRATAVFISASPQ